MLNVVKEVNAILSIGAGSPFFAEMAVKDFAKFSKDHADAAKTIISFHAIKLDCGRVVIPE